MPVSFSALGDTLTVSIIDENFEVVQRFLQSGVVRDDITGQFDRYQVLRYTGGKLVAATLFAGRLLDSERSGEFTLDCTYRNEGWAWDSYHNMPQRAMEFLGKPGPSFYFDWQEDGLDESTYLTPLASWPPTGWPFSRYPRNVCFSNWLTIPGATLRTWVGAPAVARVYASALGELNFSPDGLLSDGVGGPSYALPDICATNINFRAAHPYRFALFVDTNPELHDDEFINSNPNIDGASCSWYNIKEKALYAGQRENFELMGEVALQGNRYYNFSFKHQDWGIKGWAGGAVSIDTFFPSDYSWAEQFALGSWLKTPTGYVNEPSVSAAWELAVQTQTRATLPADVWAYIYGSVAFPPFVKTWESAVVHVQFFYGRTTAYLNDSSDAEFDQE